MGFLLPQQRLWVCCFAICSLGMERHSVLASLVCGGTCKVKSFGWLVVVPFHLGVALH